MDPLRSGTIFKCDLNRIRQSPSPRLAPIPEGASSAGGSAAEALMRPRAPVNRADTLFAQLDAKSKAADVRRREL